MTDIISSYIENTLKEYEFVSVCESNGYKVYMNEEDIDKFLSVLKKLPYLSGR